MRLSISNIAWPSSEEGKFLKLIKGLGCSGLEIAPGKVWKEPKDSTMEERRAYRSLVNDNGLEISALQALLYTRHDLGLFLPPQIEHETAEYLKRLCQLASDLGAGVLVFGSPANRRRGNMPIREATKRAATFFSKIAPTARGLGVSICIEPLRPQETDFVTSAAEGMHLVEIVNDRGFGLHLDAKAVAEEKVDFLRLFKDVNKKLRHFHINDPDLTEVNSTGSVDHFAIGRALREAGYARYVSIEMRTQADYDSAVRKSVEAAKAAYLGN